MEKDVIILVVEKEDSQFSKIEKNLHRVSINNQLKRFRDFSGLLEFLDSLKSNFSSPGQRFILILDICSSEGDGMEVLEKIKKDPKLKRIPVMVLDSESDEERVSRCHRLGCSIYMLKPDRDEIFYDTIRKTGKFLSVIRVPQIF